MATLCHISLLAIGAGCGVLGSYLWHNRAEVSPEQRAPRAELPRVVQRCTRTRLDISAALRRRS